MKAMAPRAKERRTTGVQPPAGSDARLFRLTRFSQIFSAVVREVLEVGVLRDVSADTLSASQFHVLRLMSLNGAHQVGQVADFLGVSAPAATKNIDKLVRLGLVTRRESPGDRRASLLTITPRGRRLVQRFERRKANLLAPVLGSMAAEEVEQFADLLERFALALLQQEKPLEKYCLRCAAYVDSGCPVARIRGGCAYQRTREGKNTRKSGGNQRKPPIQAMGTHASGATISRSPRTGKGAKDGGISDRD
jgi:DNA-binding MarR family transcriptional regulator